MKGVGEKTAKKLNELGIFSAEDVLEFFPKTYFDMTKTTCIEDMQVGEYVLLQGTISNISSLYRKSAVFNVFSAKLQDSTGEVKLTWFNMPYLRNNLEKDMEYRVWGKVVADKKKLYLSNPSFERVDSGERLMGIVPIYSLKGKAKQASFGKIVADALAKVEMPSMLDKTQIVSYQQALKLVHAPKDMGDVYVGKNRVAKENLTYEILAYLLTRGLENQQNIGIYDKEKAVIEEYIDKLPYKLSPSQNVAIDEIIANMKGDKKANHLLVGDVGSGKTIVALLCMIFAVQNGYQTALMAPTEILANQHFNTAKEYFGWTGLNIELLTSSTPAKEKTRIQKDVKSGKVDILIGTHAVIGDKVEFANLKFIVIDELHKFGVRQKSKLETKSYGVDTLVMSATPIPRMLAISIYGDVKISQLEARQDRSSNISTYIIGDDKLDGLYNFVKERVACGEQAYIVCPLVEDSEGMEIYSAKTLYEELKNDQLKDVKLGLLYGKMKQQDKSDIMQAFYDGDIDVLIATSIVEVGIDSKRTSCIAVLNSDRFGLAGLHQLRGRVGRVEGQKAYCFLHTSRKTEKERLVAIRDNTDGMAIAEIDGEIRGYGDFFGFNQSGGGLASAVNKKMLEECKKIVDKILDENSLILEQDDKLKKIMERVKNISLA